MEATGAYCTATDQINSALSPKQWFSAPHLAGVLRLSRALVSQVIDDAKHRAVKQHEDYETFKNMVSVAHLKPLEGGLRDLQKKPVQGAPLVKNLDRQNHDTSVTFPFGEGFRDFTKSSKP